LNTNADADGRFEGYYNSWRSAQGFDYVESSRVKFRPKHANYDASFSGFFFDDLVTETFNTNTGVVIDSYATGFE